MQSPPDAIPSAAPHWALLDDDLTPDGASWLFEEAERVVTAHAPEEVVPALRAIEAATREGLFGCGWIAYEAAAAWGLACRPAQGALVCFGLFRRRTRLDRAEVDALLAARASDEGHLLELTDETSDAAYDAAIAAIHEELRAGNSYQVNYTTRLRGRVGGDPLGLYARLRRAQPVGFGAWLDLPGGRVLSRSPELFFRRAGDRLTVRPMKGTARREADPIADAAAARALAADTKQRAENVMIVDLLRNDLGRVARPGTVEVERLFEVETYETVHQMTSTVACDVEAGVDLPALMAALFPCGSITGAPKRRTCEIIAGLERSPRGIYCGAIGQVAPPGAEGDAMAFSVAIRTLTAAPDRTAAFGVGGGIVIDSTARAERAECRAKARFLEVGAPDLRVIEALRWSPDTGMPDIALHRARMAAACRELGFPPPPDDLEARLAAAAEGLGKVAKLRLEWSRDGVLRVGAEPLGPPAEGPLRAMLSPVRIDAADPLRRHKTTCRRVLDGERARLAAAHGVGEAIFANADGALTEASYHSLLLRFGDGWHTPALDCGLLDGVGRRRFLAAQAEAGTPVVERAIPIAELWQADAVVLVNSVRGLVPAEVVR